jgi:hypothetical protein
MENEKRLIDANALLEKMQFRLPIDNNIAEVIAECVEIARRIIENAPTVDAVEAVRGEWVQIGYDKAMDRITCSCCKEYWNIADNDTESFNYCPNCGPKMDGGNEDA